MTDVLIVGAGPLGLALSLALHRGGCSSQLIDARPPGQAALDRRVLALSHGTRQILERLNAWPHADVTPIHTIHVSQAGKLGRTLITASDLAVPALGYVIEAGRLWQALDHEREARGIPMPLVGRACGVRTTPDAAWLTVEEAHSLSRPATEDQREHPARLIAWAEGAIDDTHEIGVRHYKQQAIVAIVRTQHSHAQRAYERFTAQGPVALLPLGERHATVIARKEHEAQRWLALDDDAFCRELTAQFGGRLMFSDVGSRSAIPLSLRWRRKTFEARNIWLGNAAQTLHPVAGQGFNLGLRDAYELATHLTHSNDDPGDPALLCRHAARRKMDRHGAMRFTDTMARIFIDAPPLLGHALGSGLLALDMMPPARRFLARRMIWGARAWV